MNTQPNSKRTTSYSLEHVIDMIVNHDATWEDIEEYTGRTRNTIQKRLRTTYSASEANNGFDYELLLDLARENAKKKKELAELLASSPEDVEMPYVIVTETGYLMKMGINNVLNQGLDIYIPNFCVNELRQLENTFSSAEDILGVILWTRRISRIKLKKEVVFKKPSFKVKDRTLGIVALCCHLHSCGLKIRLLTTSYDVVKLAKAQDFPPGDVKVEFVSKTAKISL